MGLLTKEVSVKLGSYNIIRYESLGYEIPRPVRIRYDSNGWKRGTTTRASRKNSIEVKVEDLPDNSGILVQIECDKCGENVFMTWREYLTHYRNNNIFCRECRNKQNKEATLKRQEEKKKELERLKRIKEKERIAKKQEFLKQQDSEYKHRLDNPRYKMFISNVLDRDNYTCQCCGKTIKDVTIEIHHLNGYNWSIKQRCDENNGICLCEDCHKEFHRYYGYGYNMTIQYKHWMIQKGKGNELVKHIVCSKLRKRPKKENNRLIYCIENHEVLNTQDDSIKQRARLCCEGKYYSVFGKHYVWYDEFLTMTQEDITEYIRLCDQKTNGLNVVCLNFNILFKNATQASKYFGSHNRNEITKCCKGESAKGITLSDGTELKWIYLDDYLLKGNTLQDLTVPTGDTFNIKKKNYSEMVLCINDGIVFDSYRLAGNYYNISKSTVKSCCINNKPTRGNTKNKGLKFRFVEEHEDINNFKHITINNIKIERK